MNGTAIKMENPADERRLQYALASFSKWAAQNEMHFALHLLGNSSVRLDDKIEALAGVSNRKGLAIRIHPLALDLFDQDQNAFFFLLMHEIRHIVQGSDFSSTSESIDLGPIEAATRKRIEKAGLTALVSPSGGKKQEELRWEIFNIAADAALHEDLRLLFGDRELGVIDEFLKKQMAPKFGVPPEEVGLITVEKLSKQWKRNLPRGQDWMYYANEYVSFIARDVEEDPEGSFEGILKKMAEARKQGLDCHDFGNNPSGEAESSVFDAMKTADEARSKSKERYNQRNAQSSRKDDTSKNVWAGMEGGISQTEITARKKLNENIKRVLELIKAKFRYAFRVVRAEGPYTYSRANRLLSDLPGRGYGPVKKSRNPAVVLALDTSGSMWFPEFLEQMAYTARYLHARGTLNALYCCDTVLHRIDLGKSGEINLRGGGGTMWTREENSKILEDLGLTKGVDIYYCTDEAVMGLEDAMQDERVVIHIINIPNLLGGMTEEEVAKIRARQKAWNGRLRR
jgi:hypothetical protein